MINYEEVVVRKATIYEVDAIMDIIHNRCDWLDSKHIEQWNVTRTYKKIYYMERVKEEMFYVAIYNGVIARNFYASNN